MRDEIDFLKELEDFIYKELSDKDAIKIRKLLFKRLDEIKQFKLKGDKN